MIPPCICPAPGYCERWQRTMTGRVYELCSGRCPPERPCSGKVSSMYRAMWDAAMKGLPVGPQITVIFYLPPLLQSLFQRLDDLRLASCVHHGETVRVNGRALTRDVKD